MAINYDLYRTFFYVAKHKNITLAAKAMFVTQPTVTHAIQSLEASLGCILFIRSQKGVALTPEAKMLYEHVTIAFDHLFEAETHLTAFKELEEGSMSIGASETTLHHFLMPYLSAFRKEHPKIRLKIANTNTPAALASVQSGALDCAVLVLPQDYKSETLIIKKLKNLQDILIAGNRYNMLACKNLSIKDLKAYPLVCMEKETGTRTFIEEFFQKHHLAFRPDIELATSDLIVPIIEHGLGIGFVPAPFAAIGLQQQTIFKLTLKEILPTREICLIHKQNTPLSIAATTFTNMLC